MEMQKKYEQTVYNICQLILKRKFKRAIYIAQSIEAQGFSNHQLLTLKSYAISKSQGPQKALDSIKYEQGPLISTAKAQYYQSLHHWQQSSLNFEHLSVDNQLSPVDNFINSNQVLEKGKEKQIELVKSKTIRLVCDHRQQECTQRINELTSQYNDLKLKRDDLEISLEQCRQQCLQLALKYENLLRVYRPKKQMLVLLQQYIRYLRQSNQP